MRKETAQPGNSIRSDLMPHNQVVYDKIITALQKTNNVLLVQGTGVGKSFVFMALAAGPFAKKRIAYVVPKLTIERNMQKYDGFEDVSGHVTFITYNRFCTDDAVEESLRDYDVVVVDEAHHLGSPIFGRYLRKLLDEIRARDDKTMIAMTATPVRDTDKMDVSVLFDCRVDGLSTLDAIEAGIMPQVEYLVCSTDITEEERRLFREALDIEASASMLEDIIRDNPKKRWLVFFTDLETLAKNAKSVQRMFPGHRLIRITSDVKHSQDEIDRIGDDERVVILSVDMLLEGIHLPEMQGILLFRKVHSLTVFTQIFGRITCIGATETPLFVDCTETAFRMQKKLQSYPADYARFHPQGAVRDLLTKSLKNSRYIEIAELLQVIRDNGKPVIIDGTAYRSIHSACDSLGVDYRKVIRRVMRNGGTHEEAILYCLSGKNRIKFEGHGYGSVRECCDAIGIDARKVYRLTSAGMDPQEAIQRVVDASAPFVFRGQDYLSMAECCETFGIRESNVRSRALRYRCSIEEAIEYYVSHGTKKLAKEVTFRGVTYPTQRSCLQAHGYNADYQAAVNEYAKKCGITWEEALDRIVSKRDRNTIIIDGRTYSSKHQAILGEKVSPSKVNSLIKQGMSLPDAIRTAKTQEPVTAFTFRGTTYPSFRAACEEYGYTSTRVDAYARKRGRSKEEALEDYIEGRPFFNFRGKSYPSAKACCTEYGVSFSTAQHLAKRKGITTQEALELVLSGMHTPGRYEIELNGVTYHTAAEACKENGLSYGPTYAAAKRKMDQNPEMPKIEAWTAAVREAVAAKTSKKEEKKGRKEGGARQDPA